MTTSRERARAWTLARLGDSFVDSHAEDTLTALLEAVERETRDEERNSIVEWLDEWAVGASWGYSRPTAESKAVRNVAGAIKRGDHRIRALAPAREGE